MSSNRISIERRAASVRRYIQTDSITTTQRWCRSTYGSPVPSGDSIRRWHDHFIRFGIVADRQRSGRPPVSLDDVSEIENPFNENTRLSTRNAERELRIPRSNIRDVIWKKPKMFLYKISFLQEPLPIHCVDRLNWAWHCHREVRKDSQYLSRIVSSDECLLHMNGTVNQHNARIWYTEGTTE